MKKQVQVERESVKETRSSGDEATLQEELPARQRALNFRDPRERETHLRAFLAWLPKVLHDAPGIDWTRLPSDVMGYLIRSVGDSLDAIPIALAISCAMDGVGNNTLHTYSHQLTSLLRRLRTDYGMREFSELGTRQIWDRFVAGRTLSPGDTRSLTAYESLQTLHVRAYLERLTERQRVVWEQYALPQLPAGFIKRQGQHDATTAASEQRRREQTDVLIPLFPLLLELAQLRKQAAERLIKEFRKHRDRAIAGEIELPYHFQYTDRLFKLSEDASTLSALEINEHEVTYSLTLWTQVSWMQVHAAQYEESTRLRAKRQQDAYAPSRTMYFLQYQGQPENFLWFGTLIAKRLLGYKQTSAGKNYREYAASRPGLLTPVHRDSKWLSTASRAVGDAVLFEPESLYRGTLFATALATLALTSGNRVNELLQVSAKRFETLIVDELKNQLPTGRKIGILVQKLLPKGYRHENERQFFLISEMAGRLLAEIGQLLEAAHGGSIPIVHPYEHSKAEDLHPEPYLFQWAASADGRIGMLTSADVEGLLRFLFYGLTLTTRTGKPIRVAPHLLRHVLATHARTVQKVPAEAVAFLLHHRVLLPDSSRALTISVATAYYSRLPLEQLLALLFEAQATLPSRYNRSYLQVPLPSTLEQMDAPLRRTFEEWSTIGPTVFGFCSAGVCVRPNNRALCLNCPFLVPHYSNLRNAQIWRKLYTHQAELHDVHGHHVDAQQSRQLVQYLDDLIRIMEIQIRTRQDGGYLPFADTLPSGQDNEGEHA